MTTIRLARTEDSKSLLDCEIHIWESLRGILPEEWVSEEITRIRKAGLMDHWKLFIQDETRIVLVAVEEDQVVGLAYGRVEGGGTSWLSFLGVHLESRGKGLGRSLLQRFVDEAKGRGQMKVSLNTAPQLKAAISLYNSMGFLPEGLLRRHSYGVDLIIYSRFLD
ncbi:MAG: GNAT family N-acetyltransferase [Promethearchaeota archaeon]